MSSYRDDPDERRSGSDPLPDAERDRSASRRDERAGRVPDQRDSADIWPGGGRVGDPDSETSSPDAGRSRPNSGLRDPRAPARAADSRPIDARGGEMRTGETRSEGGHGRPGSAFSADVPTTPVPAMEGYGGEPVSPRRPAQSDGDGIYRTSRPAIGALLVMFAIIAGALVGRIFLIGIFGKNPNASDALGGLFGIVGIPIFTAGLYAVMTGAASPVTQLGPRIWLRTPLLYLPIGLLLFAAAGMAA